METNNKLREAMIEILKYIESFHKYITPGKGKKLTALFAVVDTIRDKARAALAAPPRNCDLPNPEERYSEFCSRYQSCFSCPHNRPAELRCDGKWLLALAEEGGAE